jgi:protein-L-isoaspartate(D-aspartate) O-methyltransferase
MEEEEIRNEELEEEEDLEEDEIADQGDDERRQAIFAQMWRNMMGVGIRLETVTNADLIQRLKVTHTLKCPLIEQAFLDIPREFFVTADLKDEAYIDHPLRFAKMGFNISAPHMYTMCLENLAIKDGDKVLDIGSGSGYFTILAGQLCGNTGFVHGLDVYDHIIEFAQNNIKSFLNDEKGVSLGKTFDNVKFFKRNCFLPTIDGTLYDKIHVGACCPDAKIQELYDILAPGGTLVTPYGDRLIKSVKDLLGVIHTTTLVEVRYSDLLLPSSAEIKEAQIQIEIERANKIVVPADKRLERLGEQVNNKLCSDILFEVNGRPIYAHKIVFSVQYPLFYSKIQNECVIKIEDFGPEAFLSMLNFVYTGSFTAGQEYWKEILDIAKNFQFENLEAVVTAKLNNQAVPIVSSFDQEITKYTGKEPYSDIKFSVGDTLIPAHKLILVAQSDHFRRMFAGSFKESLDGVIKIFDCTEALFMKVLDFIYTGNCAITEADCFGILEQANFFQLTRLIAMCEIFWYDQINIENAACVLDFGNHFNALQLKQFAMEYIFKNVDQVVQTNSWKELDIDLISSVLVFSVQRGK